MKHDLTVDIIYKAKLENIVKLAKAIGIENLDKMLSRSDAKWRISCAIIRWYKRNHH